MFNEIQQNNEMLSAFIDAEQSDIETSQIINALLSEPELKQQYVRMQLVNDHLHEQVQHADIRHSIVSAINDLPAHFLDEAVVLQAAKIEDVTTKSSLQTFFAKMAQNRVLSGVSVAASVMLVTLFTLQTFNNEDSLQSSSEAALASSANTTTVVAENAYRPSLIQLPSALPATFVSGSASLANISNETIKQQYQWIEADPELSRQVRQYVNEHESRRATYHLQPQIRTATYQLSQ